MFISKCNKLFHKHGRIAFAILTVLIIVPFILYFSVAPDEILGSFTSIMNKSNISMYGKMISKKELERNINTAMIAMLLQGYPRDFLNTNEGNKQIENFAIDRMILLKEAGKLGIKVGDSEIADFIRKSPYFSDDKGFSYEKYKLFVYEMGSYGLSETEVTNSIRETLEIEALENEVTSSTLITYAGLETFYNNMNLSFIVRSAIFPAKNYLDKVSLNAKDIQRYFESNKSLYTIPKKSKAIIAEFDFSSYKDKAQKTITKDKIDNYYKANKKSYSTMSEKDAKAKIKEELTNEYCESEAKMDAQNFAVNVFKLIVQGQNTKLIPEKIFNNYAQKNKYHIVNVSQWFSSQDQNMGKLGKQAELAEAISELFFDQPISNAIKGEKAYYVACLTGREEAHDAELNEVKEKVISDYKSAQAILMAKDAAVKTRNIVLKTAKNGKISDNVLSDNNFAKGTLIDASDYKTVSSIEDGDEILSLAMKTKQGTLSEVEDIPEGAIMIYVDKVNVPSKEAFEKARSQVETQYKQYLQQMAWINYCLMQKTNANVLIYNTDASLGAVTK